jgi:hypothetical protein
MDKKEKYEKLIEALLKRGEEESELYELICGKPYKSQFQDLYPKLYAKLKKEGKVIEIIG